MTSAQVLQQAIILSTPILAAIVFVSFKEKKFKSVIEVLYTFGIQYGLIFGSFYLLTQNNLLTLTPDVSISYMIAGIIGLTAVMSKKKIVDFTFICIFATILTVAFLQKELIILISIGVASGLLSALVVRAFITFASKWKK